MRAAALAGPALASAHAGGWRRPGSWRPSLRPLLSTATYGRRRRRRWCLGSERGKAGSLHRRDRGEARVRERGCSPPRAVAERSRCRLCEGGGRGGCGLGVRPPNPPSLPASGWRGDSAPGGEAGRPLTSPPAAPEGGRQRPPASSGWGIGGEGWRRPPLPPSFPSSARGVLPCSPGVCPLGSQGNCRLLASRQAMAVISVPH